MTNPTALILYGQGINCDNETKRAFETAGARTEKALMSQLISSEKNINEYNIMVLPGGFSYGDDIAAGRVMAVRFKHNLGEQVQKFVDEGKPILGICNGFQVLVDLGLLPGFEDGYKAALLTNDSGMFEDRWVHLKLDPQSPCIFTKGIESLYLPVRHGEGKFFTDSKTLQKMGEGRQIVAGYVCPHGESNPGYPWNPNGSIDDVAGICDPTGRIFGLMPHPEACTEPHHHPIWTRNRKNAEYAVKCSNQIFKNTVDYVRSNL